MGSRPPPPPGPRGERAPRGYPPLTAEQRKDALRQLREYLAGPYGRKLPYHCPTYTLRDVSYPADDLPEGYVSSGAGRRGVGGHADPTYAAVTERLLGPRRVTLQVPDYRVLPYDWLRELVQPRGHALLPSPLAEALEKAILRGKGSIGTGLELRVARSTVDERCQRALGILCAVLYAERWREGEGAAD